MMFKPIYCAFVLPLAFALVGFATIPPVHGQFPAGLAVGAQVAPSLAMPLMLIPVKAMASVEAPS
ncbi:MAG: hypothetical protein ACFN4S_07855, partial [Prevotella conceptionensis]